MNALRFLCLLGILAAASGLHGQFGGFDLGKVVDTAKNVGKVAKGVAGIGPEEERVIGGSVAVEIVDTYGGLVRDGKIMQRVNLIGRTLAGFSDRPGLTWRFGVLASNTVNAFSAPSGYVFITRGLYQLAADDDALAAVLAHEIAHITARHALKIVARGDFLAGASSIAASQSGNVRNLEAQLQQFDLGVKKITETLFTKGFDPQTEYEADHIGRDLAAVTGYSRDGLRLMLQRLQSQSTGDTKQVFSTHPPLTERIKRLSDGATK
jgi:predicted Zn-dependent protease